MWRNDFTFVFQVGFRVEGGNGLSLMLYASISTSIRITYWWTDGLLPLYQTMATASVIRLSSSQPANYRLSKLSQESAEKASELLTKNHREHHIFFNQVDFALLRLIYMNG